MARIVEAICETLICLIILSPVWVLPALGLILVLR